MSSELQNGAGKAVLIIDDEPDVARPIAFRLEMSGFEVVVEPDGQLGYERAVNTRPDIVLLDVMMPGLDGIEVCRMLKRNSATRGIPVVMVTAKTTAGDVEAAFDAEASDYVSKPFEWAELRAKIDRLVGES